MTRFVLAGSPGESSASPLGIRSQPAPCHLLTDSLLEPLDPSSELFLPMHHTPFPGPRKTKGAEVSPAAPRMLPMQVFAQRLREAKPSNTKRDVECKDLTPNLVVSAWNAELGGIRKICPNRLL